MKIAIHQPEHFPYEGFFQKMEYSDVFIILDDVQYSKGNWQNRNKFLRVEKKWDGKIFKVRLILIPPVQL